MLNKPEQALLSPCDNISITFKTWEGMESDIRLRILLDKPNLLKIRVTIKDVIWFEGELWISTEMLNKPLSLLYASTTFFITNNTYINK